MSNETRITTSGTWVCDCNSERYSEPEQSVTPEKLQRWNSSGNGYSDVRLTETNADNLNPMLRMKSTYEGIVLYQSTRDGPIPKIYASAFRGFPDYNTFASASEAIVSPTTALIARSDISMGVTGANTAFEVDWYDNLFVAVEDMDTANCDALDRRRFINVYRWGTDDLDWTVNYYGATGITGATGIGPSECVERLTCNPFQDPTPTQISKMIRVRNEFVRYHTTYRGIAVAVVSTCNIVFEILGTPEIVAVRLRNGQSEWGSWVPLQPETAENITEIPWTLAKKSGMKTVYMQFSTYNGLSKTVSVDLVADYDRLPYRINFYKPVPGVVPGTTAYTGTGVYNDANLVNIYNNVFPVAALEPPGVTGRQVIQPDSSYVFFEVIPGISMSTSLTCDLFTQGSYDALDLPTTRVEINGQGRYRGAILVGREDGLNYKDGLAMLAPRFPEDCTIPYRNAAAIPTTQPIRDFEFNVMPIQEQTEEDEQIVEPFTDPWAAERDQYGRIQYRVSICPSEDPYFAFGDPNYRLKDNETT